MKARRLLALVLVCLTAVAWAQTKIVIPAGTPEDQAIQAIQNENDAQKRTAMWEEFVQKFAANPAAVAYGNWQLSQTYQTLSDLSKALAYGDRALAVMPDTIEILVSQAGIAQQMKDNAKVLDYAVRGGAIMLAFEKKPKPEGTSDTDFANQHATEKAALQPSADYLEVSGYNAISQEENAKLALAGAERFLAAFPDSKFKKPITAAVLIALQKNSDVAGLNAYAEKVLGPNPDDPEMLSLLAKAFVDDPKNTYLAKADVYARKAIELTKDNPEKANATGFAHMVLGNVLLKQEKTAAGITELKMATTMLKGDPADQALAYYLLGYAHAKLREYGEARAALSAAIEIPGPVQPLAKDMLDKVNAAGKPTVKK